MRGLGRYIVGAAAIVAAVLTIRGMVGARDAEWQARVDRVISDTEVALAEGTVFRSNADSLTTLADSLRIEASRRDTVIQEMIVELPAPPAECETFTLPRDRVILTLGEQIVTITAEAEAERGAAQLLRLAEAHARMSADSLRAVLDDRPKPLPSFIPRIGLGATAGVNSHGQPDVVFGFTLSWEVKLF